MAAFLATGCIRERCSTSADCPKGKVCVALTGECRTPACVTDGECGQGKVCDGLSCVAGCKSPAECGSDETCFAKQCVPKGECSCPGAPPFCGPDINPFSPTAGQSLCVPQSFPDGVALFFGSVRCSHCRGIFAGLDSIAKGIAAKGEKPRLAWVQLKTEKVLSPEVGNLLPDLTEPVIHDTDALDVWKAYLADWYHLVIVDRNGCLLSHLGPLDENSAQGAMSKVIESAWIEAGHAECNTGKPDHVEAAESAPDQAEPVKDVVEKAPELPEPPAEVVEPSGDVLDPGDILDSSSVDVQQDETPAADNWETTVAEDEPILVEEEFEPPDLPADLPGPEPIPDVPDVAETAVEVDAEPFVLQDTCQVVPGDPIQVGQKAPHFLCKNVNPSSALNGTPVADYLLAELVWIAYFGSCT